MATLDDQGSIESTDPRPAVAEPPLYDGQRLDQPTFHGIYARMPEDFRAELIDGVVYLMNMPLYADHADPDSRMIGVLFTYSIETSGTIVRNSITTILGPKSEVQPDACLLIAPDHGGRTGKDAKGAMVEAPELVVEISNSTIRLDLNAKKHVYEKAGALEYIVFDVPNERFHWFALVEGRFEPLTIEPDGLYHSRAFPGLWIDEAAFVGGDGLTLIAALRRGLASQEHAEFVERLAANRANRP